MSSSPSGSSPLRITLIYLLTGLIWIFGSDSLLSLIFTSSLQQAHFQTYKGIFYVCSTALLLYYLLRRYYDNQLRRIQELQLSECRLLESEERYQFLFRESPLAKIIYEPASGYIVEVNTRAQELFGYSELEMLGVPISDLIQLNSESGLLDACFAFERKDGQHFFLEHSAHPFTFRGNRAVLLIFSDVTERESAQMMLRENQRKLIAAQKIAKIGYWESVNGLYWSDEVYEIWGLDKNTFDLSYENFLTTIHPDDRHLFYNSEENPDQLEIEYEIEHRFFRPDGSIRWALERGKLSRKDANSPFIGGGTVQDITEAKLLSLSRQESLQRYDYLTKATSDAIWDWDLQTDQFQWGSGFEALSGYDAETIALMGRQLWTNHIAGEDSDMVVDGLQRVMAGRESVWKEEYRLKRVDGKYLFVINHAYILRDEKGRPIRIVGAIRDITERKRNSLQKDLVARISEAFNAEGSLDDSLKLMLQAVVDAGHFDLGEIWMVAADRQSINLKANCGTDLVMRVFNAPWTLRSVAKGEGLPGICWQEKRVLYWPDPVNDARFIRSSLAAESGITSIYAHPLIDNDQVFAVLILGQCRESLDSFLFSQLLDSIQLHLIPEIRRKQAEVELGLLFRYAPDVICVLNKEGCCVRGNPALYAILGYSEEALRAAPIWTFATATAREGFREKLQHVYQGGPSVYFECGFIAASGKTKWLSWTISAPSNESSLYCAAKDVTEERELHSLWNKASRLATIGAWDCDLMSQQVHWSSVTREIHGVDEHFLPTVESCLSFYPEGKERNQIQHLLSEAIATGKGWDVESQIITPAGTKKWVRSIGEAEMLDGTCIRLYGSLQDVDQIKRSEKAIVDALRERALTLERIGDGFVEVDNEWTITYWNSSSERLLDRSRDEVVGRNLWEMYPHVVKMPIYDHLSAAKESGSPVVFEAFFAQYKAWYEVSVFPSSKGLSIFLKDITERRNYIETIERHNKTLKDIAWSQSHEVRSPLARIMALVRLINDLRPQMDTELSGLLDMILGSANDLDEIIRKITERANPEL
jgi:PAS domain S-box-containing protein